jgi:hypothetical protein
MHRNRLVFVLVGAAWLLALGVPRPALGCTGCLEPLADVVGPADRVLLGTFLAASETTGYRFSVERALKGSSSTVVDFAPGASQTFTAGSRWILVLYPGHELDTVNAFAVEPNGTVVAPGPFDTPKTLAAFIAWFATPPTDTVASSPAASTSAVVLAAVFLSVLVAALLGRRVETQHAGAAGVQDA